MKMQKLILSVFCSVLIEGACAQVQNFAFAGADVGYAALLDNKKAAQPAFGAGASINIGYELQYRKLLFDVGLTGRFARSVNTISDDYLYLRMLDTEGDEFNYNCHFFNTVNKLNSAYISVPVMIGFQTGKMYMLAGAKMLLSIAGVSEVSTYLTTTASYDRYIGELQNMPDHFVFEDRYMEGNANSLLFAPQLNVCAEIGWRLEHSIVGVTGYDVPKKKIQYRIGLFAEYGVLDQHKHNATQSRLSYYDNGEGLQYDINHIYGSVEANDLKLANLFVGIRFTVLFKIPETKDCVLCKDNAGFKSVKGGGKINAELHPHLRKK